MSTSLVHPAQMSAVERMEANLAVRARLLRALERTGAPAAQIAVHAGHVARIEQQIAGAR